MKNIILVLLLTTTFAAPAHAVTARKIIGAPFFAVGFIVVLVADITVVPLYKGATHYIYAPAIKGW